MKLDRTVAPPFGKLDHFALQLAQHHVLDNGTPVYAIEAGTQDVLMVQVVFPCGKAAGHRKLVATTTAALMEEGSLSMTGAAIAGTVDYFGAQLHADTDEDETSFTLHTLSRHLADTLPVMAEICQRPSFPEEELAIHVRNQRQSAEVSDRKVGNLARKAFKGVLFGTEHPLGRTAIPADYDSLHRDELVDHFHRCVEHNIQHIIVAGRLTVDTLRLLNLHFGTTARKIRVHDAFPDGTLPPQQMHVPREGAVQNAIRVGRVLFNRNHPDFVGMQFLCTVLGGYFGSRLMANIREDKGYTYGIGANLTSLRHTGHLTISTEVGAQVCDAALEEIFREMELLRTQAVSATELETVRNYLLGVILKSLDGPFAIAGKWRGYLKYGVGAEAHDSTIRQITAMDPDRLLELAQRYLRPEDMSVVTAGVRT